MANKYNRIICTLISIPDVPKTSGDLIPKQFITRAFSIGRVSQHHQMTQIFQYKRVPSSARPLIKVNGR